jgi:hypothetical protein
MKPDQSSTAGSTWLIHDIAPDFTVLDTWALDTPGRVDDFAGLVEQFVDHDLASSRSAAARLLFRLRWRLGEWFGWDDESAGLDHRVESLRSRVDPALAARSGPDPRALPFRTLYQTDTEWAGEMANRTVHGVLHLGWVRDPAHPGAYRGQLTVLVRPNAVWGRAYMAGIAPFRHLVVYPSIMRGAAAHWRARLAPPVQSSVGEIPYAARRHLTIGSADYVDDHWIRMETDRSPQWWARTIFDELVSPMGRFFVFRLALGLRPTRGGRSVGGWALAESTDTVARLTRGGPRHTGELVVVHSQGQIHMALALRHHTRLGAVIWSRLAPIHRRMSERLLRAASVLARLDTSARLSG